MLGDGNPSEGSMSDAAFDASEDAYVDAPLDAVMGTLSPDPPLPASIACTGVLGFPNPPMFIGREDPRVGDLEGNGVLDLVTRDGSDLYVARGHGNGTFTKIATITPPGAVRAFAFVDMNLDARPDLLVNSTVGQNVSTYIAVNDGAGNFGAFSRIESTDSRHADAFLVADVDRDTRPDIIIVTASSRTITVVRRTGTLGYTMPEVYMTGGGQFAYDAAISDLTGDGFPEIAFINTGTVNVMVNSGGTFASSVAYPTTNGEPRAVEIADMNEDGEPDVVAILTDGAQAKLAVLPGDGVGGLGPETTVTLYPWESLFSSGPLTLGDLNNDAHIDVVVGYGLVSSVAFMLGTGAAQFGSVQRLHQGRETRPIIADVNNDARLDLVSGTASGVTTFLNNGTSTLFADRIAFPSGGVPQGRAGLTFLDLDGGPLDFVYAFRDQSGHRISKASGNADGTFGTPTLESSIGTGRTVVGDLDNDSKRDLVVVGSITDAIAPGSVSGGFATFLVAAGTVTSTGSHMLDVSDPESVDLVDLDGNGFRDIVIGSRGAYPFYPSAVTYYPGLGAGQFGAGVTVWSGVNLMSAAVGDLNGDTKPDVVVHYYGTETHEVVLRNLGAGMFSILTVGNSSTGEFPASRFVIADVNHDGKNDLAGVSSDLIVKLGAGDGTFGAPIRSIAPLFTWNDVELADFNGDSHVDLAIPTGNTVNISLGNGDGTFRAPLSFEASSNTYSLSVADTDQDGRLDILVDTFDGNVGILRARCL